MWLDIAVMKECDNNLKVANCKTRSEYIHKAIEFYNGYIHSQNITGYLSQSISTIIEGIISNTENRIARIQFKQAVELAKVFKLLTIILETSKETIDDIHFECVNEVKGINGILKYPPNKKLGDD